MEKNLISETTQTLYKCHEIYTFVRKQKRKEKTKQHKNKNTQRKNKLDKNQQTSKAEK